ncbi:PqqD family protein [Paraglaciecola sp. L3A3]|uniref:PqqD family protein n=1 Tax=Paraglaciecola sp. L3A3 TaxID=2686358 RepID=UPI00131D368B|nr:PqqD family protein [Paraglaciecola sp. L3A3]
MHIKLNQGLLIQKVVDEIVILEPESGDYYTLNETGAMMLEGLQEGKAMSEITGMISAKFNIATKDVENDLIQLLIDLERNGLAQTVDA